MIVGTAGHIDHGKTTLVRALSGVDTDRLPEERARGISIELGYAYVQVDEARRLGFVDVPGHEKLVHTMLAGATGIDFLLLVVAADDGVMPQTREHLTIASILGIERGAIAITKIDAVEPQRVAACEQECRGLVAGTVLADIPAFRVSSRSGEGIEALDAHLREATLVHSSARSAGGFRLAVDRVFTLAGIGTVVTGTIHSGQVGAGDRLALVPSGREVRVRSLRAQGIAAEVARAGERCALNLASVSREEVARGDWVVDPAIVIATDRFDATLEIAGDAAMPRASTEVHVHVAAAHTMGRVVPLADGLVQVVLRESLAVWRGDRFVLRDAAATRTLGGGTILDPLPPQRYRRSEQRLAVLRALGRPTVAAQLASLVDVSVEGVDVRSFARAGNVPDASAIAAETRAVHVTTPHGEFLLSQPVWEAHGNAAVLALEKFHRAHSDLLGLDRARLRRMALPKLDDALFRALVDALVKGGRVRESGGILHLPTHDNALSASERALVEEAMPYLVEGRFDPPWVRDLARDLRKPEEQLRSALVRAAKRGELYQVVHDLFYHPATLGELARCVSDLEREHGAIAAATFRDSTGLGRKRAIQILEYFDRIGYTRRVRDRRMVREGSPLAASRPS